VLQENVIASFSASVLCPLFATACTGILRVFTTILNLNDHIRRYKINIVPFVPSSIEVWCRGRHIEG